MEDNPINQRVALGLLRKFGLQADQAADGQQALDALAVRPYDLVFMDCQMPVMDGYQATRMIRNAEDPRSTAHCSSFTLHHAAPTPLPIIAMTANAMQDDRDKCLQAGMDDYIAKPVRAEALAELLAKWLSPASRETGD